MKFVIAVCSLAALSWFISSRLIGPEYLHREHGDRAARDYLKRALPKIVSKWDYPALEQRITSELAVSETWKAMTGKFALYKTNLGPAIEFRDLGGSVDFDYTSGSEVIIGTYTQRVDFKHGTAHIATVVIRRNNAWRIGRFSVRSAQVPASLDDDQ